MYRNYRKIASQNRLVANIEEIALIMKRKSLNVGQAVDVFINNTKIPFDRTLRREMQEFYLLTTEKNIAEIIIEMALQDSESDSDAQKTENNINTQPVEEMPPQPISEDIPFGEPIVEENEEIKEKEEENIESADLLGTLNDENEEIMAETMMENPEIVFTEGETLENVIE